MDQLQSLFNYNGQQVRTIIKDGEPWFVAKDVCDVLEIGNSSQALSRLDEDERNTIILNEGIGNPEKAIVNEPGLYSLILGSRKEEAKQFKRWITHKVLPSIRETGSYNIQKPKSQAELMLMYAEQFVAMENRVTQMEETVETIQKTFLQRDEDWRKSINTILNRAAFKLGGQYRDLRNHSYDLLEERGRCNLNIRLSNLKDRLKDEGATKTRINQTTKMDVIESEPRLKEIYSTIVKELSIGSTKAV